MDNIIINLDDGLRLGGDPLPNIASPSDIISQSDTIVGPPGPAGPAGPAGRDGEAATITVGSTTTGAAGTNAVVQNSGTSSAAVLDFTIPRGDRGETGATGATGATGPAGRDGEAATITVGSVTTVSSEYPATVTNSGTTSAAVLDFQIPQGIQGETGPAGADGRDGTDGEAATITVGSTTTGVAGTNASVTNSGTSSAAVFNFTIPRGDTGATGPAGSDGQAATVSIGSTTTLPAGSSATVTNSGTSSAAVFNFAIPKGDTGSKGPAGDTNVIKSGTTTIPALSAGEYIDVPIVISAQTSTNYSAVVTLSGSTSYWTWLRFTIANKTTTGFDIGVYNDGSGATGDVDVDYIVVKHF